uniref:Uncharacterized protein n=1 Tax=Lactuca sativa TaxID=4236 RepID=A0A9R1UWP8_LACSA|nr:hypothetical protein LSAT_V11C800417700 [Lactuca sativa]
MLISVLIVLIRIKEKSLLKLILKGIPLILELVKLLVGFSLMKWEPLMTAFTNISPDIVTAVGYGTPPCVSRDLAGSCSEFVTTDDIILRLSVATLMRLRK